MVRYTNKKQRATALMMVVDRQPATAIADAVGAHPTTAQRGIDMYNTTGVIIAKPLTPSNPTKLTPYIMEV
jgi:hypothetical protein